MILRPSNRRLKHRLADHARSTAPFGYSTDPADADENLVARLQSLAVASSIAPVPRSTRLRRQVGAVIGAVGILGWAGATAASASVGLAATGNLPAPVQEVVADVLDVVKISVPRPDPSLNPEAPVPAEGSSGEDKQVEDSISQGTPIRNVSGGTVPTSTSSSTSTTTTTSPDEPIEDLITGLVIACTTPAAEKNPECFERIDDETISIIPVISPCDTSDPSRNPDCKGSSNPGVKSDETKNTIPACNAPANKEIPYCFEETDEESILVVPSCGEFTAFGNPKCPDSSDTVSDGSDVISDSEGTTVSHDSEKGSEKKKNSSRDRRLPRSPGT